MNKISFLKAAAAIAALVASTTIASANPFFLFGRRCSRARRAGAGRARGARPSSDRSGPAHLRRQIVDYRTNEPAGTIIVDTPNTYLYYVLGNGRAMRYGIGVGRDGFTWSGVQHITRRAEWPDWTPPAEMLARQPYLPRYMAGGPGNPMGARALYLGNTIYRIHGTNAPHTIGQRVSSGCIRMTNEDVTDLYSRVQPRHPRCGSADDPPQRLRRQSPGAVRTVSLTATHKFVE